MSKTFGMERRALIAFVASMALFLLYDSLYLAPKMRDQRAKREAAAQEMARLQKAPDRIAGGDTIGTQESPPALTPEEPSDSLSAAFASADTSAARGRAHPSSWSPIESIRARGPRSSRCTCFILRPRTAPSNCCRRRHGRAIACSPPAFADRRASSNSTGSC
jgi:hypothetical protein